MISPAISRRTDLPDSMAQSLDALVVTAAPEVFAAPGVLALGDQVAVCGTLDEALFLLEARGARMLFADLAELPSQAPGAWTGLRLLRHLNEPRRTSSQQVWLMTTEKGYPHVEWVRSLGGSGVIRRSANEVLRCLRASQRAAREGSVQGSAGQDTALRVPGARGQVAQDASGLLRLEKAYSRLAPGTAPGRIERVRRERSAGRIGQTAEDYALALAHMLNPHELREALRAALLREAQLTVDPTWTEPRLGQHEVVQ